MGKDANDEFKGFIHCKSFLSPNKFSLLKHLEVKHVGYNAEKKVYLGDDDEYLITHDLIENLLKQALEYHEY